MAAQRDTLTSCSQARKKGTGRLKSGGWAVFALLTSSNYYSFYVLFLLFGGCTLFYYLGELVDFASWEGMRWDFLYGVHDVQRLLFLAPIIYAAYIFGVKATLIMTILSLGAFLPRALFISPFPDPLLRTVLFGIIAGAMGYLAAVASRESERCRELEALLIGERDRLSRILEEMGDGVLIVGPDYGIRFMNRSMLRDFGEGIGSKCYQYLFKFTEPCHQICRLPSVVNGASERWEYNFPDGRAYEVLASPYIDSDGVVCQLAVLRRVTPGKKLG